MVVEINTAVIGPQIGQGLGLAVTDTLIGRWVPVVVVRHGAVFHLDVRPTELEAAGT